MDRNIFLGVCAFVMSCHYVYTTGEPPVMAGAVTLYFVFKFWMNPAVAVEEGKVD